MMIEHSESVKAIAAALAKVQGEVENAHKNANNPHFRSSYADLAEVVNTVRPVLSAHNIAVVQVPGYVDGEAKICTMLLHESGEWIRGVSAAPVSKRDVQGVGSVITYLRRYSLAAVCGIAQEDDDGEAGAGRGGQQGAGASKPKAAKAATRDRPTPEAEQAATDAQLHRIDRLVMEREMGEKAEARLRELLTAGVTVAKANEIIAGLEGMPVKEKAA